MSAYAWAFSLSGTEELLLQLLDFTPEVSLLVLEVGDCHFVS